MDLSIPVFFPGFLETLGIVGYGPQLAVEILFLVTVLDVIVRVCLCAGYQGIYAGYRMQAKPLKVPEDAEKIKSGFFGKAVKFYIPLVERGITHISARDVVERQLGRTNFLFFHTHGLESAVKGFESGLLAVGVLLVLGLGGEFSVAVCCIVFYIVVRLADILLDFKAVKEKMLLEISNYMETELGRFFAKETVSAINLLRIEIKNTMQAQTKGFGDAISHFGGEMTEGMNRAMAKMAASIQETMEGVLAQGDILQEPMEKWGALLTEASQAQARLNETMIQLQKALGHIDKVTAVADGGFDRLAKQMQSCFESMAHQMESLTATAAALVQANAEQARVSEAASSQMGYIKTNQEALERSLQQYELTLKEITEQIGTGLGQIIDHHMQQAYDGLIEGIQENMKSMIQANAALAERMQELFEQLRDQSKTETNAMLTLREQMDIGFQELNAAGKVIRPEAREGVKRNVH